MKSKRRKQGESLLAEEKQQKKEKRQRRKKERAKKPDNYGLGDLRKLDTLVTLQELSKSVYPNPAFEIQCNGQRGRLYLLDATGATISGGLWISANTKVYPLAPRSRRHHKNVKINRE